MLLAFEIVDEVRDIVKAGDIFGEDGPHVLQREGLPGFLGVLDAELERFEEVVHLLAVTLLEEDLDGPVTDNRDLLVVGEVQVVDHALVGANQPLQVGLRPLDRSPHKHRKPSCDLGSVVEALNGQFSLVGQQDSHALLADLLVEALGQLDALHDDRLNHIVERVDQVSSKALELAENIEDKFLLERCSGEEGEVGIADHPHHVLAVPELLQDAEANREDLVVVGVDLEGLLEDGDQQLHDSDLLLLQEGVVGDPDDRADDPEDFALHQLLGGVAHDELEHVETLLHDVLTAVGDALDQHVHVVLEGHFVFPNHLRRTADVVLERDHHLPNVEGGLLTLVVRDQQEEDLMAEALENRVLEEDEGGELPDDGLQLIDLRDLGGVEEEEEHIDEYLQGLAQSLAVLVLAVVVDALPDVGVDHLDELGLVLLVQLQRDLLETVDNQTEPVLLGLVLHQLVDLLNEELSGRHLEVRVEVVGQPLGVVGDHLDLELGHRGLHDLVDHAVHHLVGVGLQQILQQVQALRILFVGLVRVVHLLDGGVEEILEEGLLVHLIDEEGEGAGEGGTHAFGDGEEVVREDGPDGLSEALLREVLQVQPLDELGQHLEDADLVVRLLQQLLEVLQDLREVVLAVFPREGDDVLEDYAVGRVRPPRPHLRQLVQAQFDGLGSVLDVGVPDLVGSEPGHFQLVVLDDVDGHEAAVVGVGLIGGAGVVDVALDDVEHFADEHEGGVALLPVVLEDAVAERVEQQVGVREAVVADQHALHHHRRVTDALVLVGHEAVHVLVHLLDEPLELLRADRRHVQEHQDVALLLAVAHRVQLLEDLVETLLEVLVGLAADHLGVGLRSALPLSGVRLRGLDDVEDELEVDLCLLDADLGGDAADGHGGDGADLGEGVAEGDLEAGDDDPEIGEQVIGVGDELDDAADHLARPRLQIRHPPAHAVVQDGDDHREGRRVDEVAETRLQQDLQRALRVVERVLQRLDEDVDALRNLRVLDGLPDEVERLGGLLADGRMRVAEAGRQRGHDDGQRGLQLPRRAVGHDAQDPDVADLNAPVLLLLEALQQLGQQDLHGVRTHLDDQALAHLLRHLPDLGHVVRHVAQHDRNYAHSLQLHHSPEVLHQRVDEVDPAQLLSLGFSDVIRGDDAVEVALRVTVADALEQAGEEVGLADLQPLGSHGADVLVDGVDDLERFLEEGHEVGHAFGDGALLVLLLALEQLGDTLLDDLQVLVPLQVGRQHSQVDDVAHSRRLVDEALQHQQQLLRVGVGVPLDDADAHVHGQLGERAEVLLGGELEDEELEDGTVERLGDVVEVDVEEEGEHLQALLVEALVKELLGRADHHVEHALAGLGRDLLLNEQAQLLDRLLRVLLHEVLHVEPQDRLLEVALLGQDPAGQPADLLVGLEGEDAQLDELLELRTVLVLELRDGLQDEALGGLDVVEDVVEELLDAEAVDCAEEAEEDGLDVVGVGEDVDVAGEVGEELVGVGEDDAALAALVVELDGQLLQVHVELHVLQQVLAHLVDQQHHELPLRRQHRAALETAQQLAQELLAVSHRLHGGRDLGVAEGEELPQEAGVLGEDAGLRAVAVEPGGEEAAARDELLDAEAVLGELGDCEDGLEVRLPEVADQRVAVERAEQLGSDAVENAQHLQEVHPVLLLLHLLLAHHLRLEPHPHVHATRLALLRLADPELHQLVAQFVELLPDLLGALEGLLLEVDEELQVLLVVVLVGEVLQQLDEVVLVVREDLVGEHLDQLALALAHHPLLLPVPPQQAAVHVLADRLLHHRVLLRPQGLLQRGLQLRVDDDAPDEVQSRGDGDVLLAEGAVEEEEERGETVPPVDLELGAGEEREGEDAPRDQLHPLVHVKRSDQVLPGRPVLNLLQEQGKDGVNAVRKLLVLGLPHELNVLQDQPETDLLLDLAEREAGDLEERRALAEVVDELQVVLGEEVQDGERALPVGLEDGGQLGLEVGEDLLHRGQAVHVFLAVDARDDRGEEDKDVLVIVLEVELARLGHVVLGVCHQRTQRFEHSRQQIELLLLGELDQAVQQDHNHLLRIKVSHLFFRVPGERLSHSLQHSDVDHLSLNVLLVADEAGQEGDERLDGILLLQPSAHGHDDLDARLCVVYEEVLDLVEKGDHGSVEAAPLAHRSKEILPHFQVGLAPHEQPLQLREELLEVRHQEGGEVLVDLERPRLLVLPVHQHLVVDLLDQARAPLLLHFSPAQVDQHLLLVAQARRLLHRHAREQLQELAELVGGDGVTDGEVQMCLCADIPPKTQRKLLVLEGEDCPTQQSDYFAEGIEVDLSRRSCLESSEQLASALFSSPAVLEEVGVEFLEEGGVRVEAKEELADEWMDNWLRLHSI